MKIKYLIGDATRPIGDGTKIIAHIVNDKGGWGKGFVLALSERWHDSYGPEQAYREWSKKKWKGRDFVLGEIQTVWVEDTTFVCNMIAQRDFRPLEEDGVSLKLPNVKYSSLLECLTRLRIQCEESQNAGKDVSIHMPRIGMGLGGCKDWSIIEKIIAKAFDGSDVPIFVYDLPPLNSKSE